MHASSALNIAHELTKPLSSTITQSMCSWCGLRGKDHKNSNRGPKILEDRHLLLPKSDTLIFVNKKRGEVYVYE